MTHIETSTGFNCDIDESCMDDMELFDAIVDLQNGDSSAIPVIVGKIAGTCKKELYEHCRNEQGRVPTAAVTAEIVEIINGIKDSKK